MNTIDSRYPSIDDLRRKAKKRIPRFAYEYLVGGANEELNLIKNIADIQKVELMPSYLRDCQPVDLSCMLFGERYDVPYGIAPIGLQGLIWPHAPEILAKSASKNNIPFVLSTVTTSSIERVGEITSGKFWFQLYHPTEEKLTDDLLERVQRAGSNVLVALADTPSFGYRYKDIRNGLSLPAKMTLKNILQILVKPEWAIKTLFHGQPEFASLKRYIPKNLDLNQLSKFMNQTFSGRLTEDKLGRLRDKWKGKLVVKGIVNPEDAEKAYKLGVDGIIVSNHGGRQLDAGQSTIKPLNTLAQSYGDKLEVMIDGGIRSGPDLARCIASGAKFAFLGRPFMYGVGALGNDGGEQTIMILNAQLKQIMEQLGCERLSDLPSRII